jgi:hypothetical protein
MRPVMPARGRQALAGLIDEFYVASGAGHARLRSAAVRLPGIEPVRWARIHDGHPAQAVDLRYRRA